MNLEVATFVQKELSKVAQSGHCLQQLPVQNKLNFNFTKIRFSSPGNA